MLYPGKEEVGDTFPIMELSQAVLDGLALAGDAAHVPDKCFPVIVTRALDGLLDEKHRHMIASKIAIIFGSTSYRTTRVFE